MKPYQLCLLSSFAWLPGFAVAQTGSPVETEFEFESVTVITPFADEATGTEVEPVLGEISLIGTSEKVLENGVRLRARGAFRLQSDHPTRIGGIGGFGPDTTAPVGAFSGLSAAPANDDSDLRGRWESAYLQVDGGYGEVRLGKDQGVAARFHEGSPSVLSHARLDSALIDPSGLSTVRTRHDLTGPSAKVSYASPRLVGVRAGVSFTPSANADGLDRRPSAGTGGFAPEIENAIELALNGTRRLRESGWRFDLGLGWSKADADTRGPGAVYQSVETFSAGTRIEKDDWTFGVSWLESDNGLPQSDYSAWSAGLHREAYSTDFSIEYGESSDYAADLESHGWRVGASRAFGRSNRLAIAYLHDETHQPLQNWETRGIVVEITLSQEIVQVSGN
ncbi:MAG: porin [Pseudomonadota bacterium]